jgi:cell division protein FtsB
VSKVQTNKSKKAKYILLDEVEKQRARHVDNLSFKLLLGVLLALFTALLVILPNIYLKNEIYYESRDIAKLYNEYSVLKEENRALKQKLEYIKFKNQVLDTIF